jgi:hypothetical protein
MKRGSSLLIASSRTWWDNYKDEDWVHEQYPELDSAQVVKATETLEKVVTYGDQATDETYHGCLKFKARAIEKATLLHYAIWVSSQAETARGVVQTLLTRMKNPNMIFMPAILPAGRHPPRITFIYAVHIAAGLGLLEELQALTEFAAEAPPESERMCPQDYIGLWACSAAREVMFASSVKARDFTNAYQAIHEATFQGHADVTLWLLSNGADPCSKNEAQITPLHFVALYGISEDLPAMVVQKTTEVVTKMVEENNSDVLIATADMQKYVSGVSASLLDPTRMIPLEVAVQSGSKFPPECVGLLAPCLASHEHYFQDIAKIALLTPRGALHLVRSIAEMGKKDPHVLKAFRLDAQKDGASDVIGSIFYTAPHAASEMLDLLEITPDVEDSAHHPVPAHVSLWGLFKSQPMRCTYQADCRNNGKLRVPSWEWRKFKEIKDDDGKVIAVPSVFNWQEQYMPSVLHHARAGHVKKVKVVTYLIPGLLDIDIVMALARLLTDNAAIMNKRAVEGIIICLWENLVGARWAANMAMMTYDLIALMTLAFFHHHVNHPAAITLALAAVFGSVVRCVLEFLCTLDSVLRKAAEYREDPVMGKIWSPFSRWFCGSFVSPLGATLLNLGFLYTVRFGVHGIKTESHADSMLEKLCFSACLLIACLQIVVMWRFSTVGATIYTVKKTITSGAVNQTLFIFGLIFISVTLILLVWSHDSDVTMILAAFRGWLFADGDGFNKLGFNQGFTTQVIFSMVAAFFFNVMTLNIIIAVYGHEYDRAQENLKFMFLRGRAHYCASSILSSYIIEWRGLLFNRCLTALAWFLMIASVCCSIALHSVLVAGFLLGCGQRMLSISLMQCDWYSREGDDAQHQQRFLWVCYPDDWQGWMDEIKTGGAHGGERAESMERGVMERGVSRATMAEHHGVGPRLSFMPNPSEPPKGDMAKLMALRQEMEKLLDSMESQIHQGQMRR